MARYAPLPSVSIDPRNESQLVQDAAQKVYEASNRTLNDFSSGNPLAVLLEGQAFAQGEFLFQANQLPDKILLEWIGPFLGAMRRLGTPATTLLTVTIPATTVDVTIPSGTEFYTNSQITGGQSFSFITPENTIIPAGQTEARIAVYSNFVGSIYNVPAYSISGSSSLGITGISVVNPDPAIGGSDVETYAEVQERFFSLIRRRNPVSKSDWEDFFTDLYGVGTLTSVQPNRSSKVEYNYYRDYELPNGQVSFFVLGPNGVELSSDQIRRGQNIVNFSIPIENQAHLYPITLSQVQYNLTLEVDANGIYGSSFQASTKNFRDRLNAVLTPGSVFPADVNPTVNDVDAAFYNTFDSTYRFKDPQINYSAAFNTPASLSKEAAIYTNVYDFEPTEKILNLHDLIRLDIPNEVYYPVISAYTPYSSEKRDQTIYGNLSLKQIKPLTSGEYSLGDIVVFSSELYVITENLALGSLSEVPNAILAGKITGPKSYSPWTVGNTYQYSSGTTIDPQIIEYDYSPDEFLPTTTVGRLAWLVSSNFTLGASTNDVTGAQTQFKIGAQLNSSFPENLSELTPGSTYLSGTWVYTPQVGGGPDASIDPYYNYVDITAGAINKYAYVISTFTYEPNNILVSDYFGSLVEQGILQEVMVFDGNNGLPIYKYSPRFKCGQYLEYREVSGGKPTYCIAAKYFTPRSTAIADLISDGSIINLAPTTELSSQLESLVSRNTNGRIKSTLLVSSGGSYQNGTYLNMPLSYSSPTSGKGVNGSINLVIAGNAVVSYEVTDFGANYSAGDHLTVSSDLLGGAGTGFTIEVTSVFPREANLQSFVRMFTFFKGDKTCFRDGSKVQFFTATSSVTPLFDFEIYYKNGVFVDYNLTDEVNGNSINIPFFNPEYSKYAEDTLVSEDGRNYYRVMTAFTPDPTVTNWSDTTVTNTARFEEYAGNLLRYVTFFRCEEEIFSQFGLETSAIKLGIAQITLVPRNSGRFFNSNQKVTYVWENTKSASESPQLSWYTGTAFPLSPPDYKEGTLKL